MNTKQREELQNAINTAAKELHLRNVPICISLVHEIDQGETAGLAIDLGDEYDIQLATGHGPTQTELIQTAGHELYHVWQYKHDMPLTESLAETYGQHLTELCCNEGMTQ